jgi:hypothetical protein
MLLTEIEFRNGAGAGSSIQCAVELHFPRKMNSLLVPSDETICNHDCLQLATIEAAA